jgi:hypothetical protein
VAACETCKFWYEFDPILGRGECVGWGKKVVEAIAVEMVESTEAATLADAATRTKPWRYPVTVFTDPECGRYVERPA